MAFNRQELQFIDKYVHLLHPGKAAISAGYKWGYGKTLYGMPEIRAEIDRRLEIINTAQAQANKLHVLAMSETERRRGLHKV
jgi:phage terminase small subunit